MSEPANTIVRTYSFKARMIPEHEKIVLDTIAKMGEVYKTLRLKKGRGKDKQGGVLSSLLRKEMGDLWWPNRVAVWEMLRKAAPLKSKKRRRNTRQTMEGHISGALGNPGGRNWRGVLEIAKTVMFKENLPDERGHRNATLEMPVSKGVSILLFFKMHREMPENAELVRWNVVSKLSHRYQNPDALSWSIQFVLREPAPEPRPPLRTGELELHVRPLKGIVLKRLCVASLVLDSGETKHYFLPEDSKYKDFMERWNEMRNSTVPQRDRIRFGRYRMDAYRKIATAICNDVDQVRIVRPDLLSTVDLGNMRNSRVLLAIGQLVSAIQIRAERVGVKCLMIDPQTGEAVVPRKPREDAAAKKATEAPAEAEESI